MAPADNAPRHARAVAGPELLESDFATEDKTYLLPATERVMHTLPAIKAGALITLLVLNTPAWLSEPTALTWQPCGRLCVFPALCGIGSGLSVYAMHLQRIS